MRAALIALMLMYCSQAAAAGTTMSNGNAQRVCTLADMDWINFCNGFIQAAADFSTVTRMACIPQGTTRTLMVKLFTTDGANFSMEKSAVEIALQVIHDNFPC